MGKIICVVPGVFYAGIVPSFVSFYEIRNKGHEIRNSPKIIAKSPKLCPSMNI